MLNAILAMTVALNFVTGQFQTDPLKPPPSDVGPGRIAWFDITTTNLAQSREFYGKLFNWNFTPVPGTELAVEIVSQGAAIGTLRVAEGKISTFNGVVYVQVTDIQASCKKSKDLGGDGRGRVPFQSVGRQGSHRPGPRSSRPSRRHVLQNTLQGGSASGEVTMPAGRFTGFTAETRGAQRKHSSKHRFLKRVILRVLGELRSSAVESFGVSHHRGGRGGQVRLAYRSSGPAAGAEACVKTDMVDPSRARLIPLHSEVIDCIAHTTIESWQGFRVSLSCSPWHPWPPPSFA
jgi:predicted enzyme related to lactoylglutathione lyase